MKLSKLIIHATPLQVAAIGLAMDDPKGILEALSLGVVEDRTMDTEPTPDKSDPAENVTALPRPQLSKVNRPEPEPIGNGVHGGKTPVFDVTLGGTVAASADEVFGNKEQLPDLSQDAPIATPPQVAAPDTTTLGEYDDQGYPWDERIHTKTKGKMKKDGSWKLKPGVDKDLVAELRTSAARIGVAPTSVSEAPTLTTTAPTTVVSEVTTYPELMKLIVGGMSTRKFEASQVSQLLAGLGIGGTGELPQHQDKWGLIIAGLAELEAQSNVPN